jgi:signal transduction histidine kinase
MLREMLSNLIDNAIRYTPSDHSITVKVSMNEQQALAIIEVEDNGPGIPVAEREHVFERFTVFSAAMCKVVDLALPSSGKLHNNMGRK